MFFVANQTSMTQNKNKNSYRKTSFKMIIHLQNQTWYSFEA